MPKEEATSERGGGGVPHDTTCAVDVDDWLTPSLKNAGTVRYACGVSTDHGLFHSDER